MRIAILSDIHSNLQALDAVCEKIDGLGVDSIYFAGDVVGYGPDPNMCTSWVLNNADVAVAGNHVPLDAGSFRSLSIQIVPYSVRELY